MSTQDPRTTTPIAGNQTAPLDAWFEDLIANIRVHQLELTTGTATPEVKKLYDTIIAGDFEELIKTNKQFAQRYLIGKIIVDYVTILGNNLPRKIAFDFNDSLVLVWAEIENDNEELERTMIMAEATVNAKYHHLGYNMDTTVVEERDQLQIPNHYKPFLR